MSDQIVLEKLVAEGTAKQLSDFQGTEFSFNTSRKASAGASVQSGLCHFISLKPNLVTSFHLRFVSKIGTVLWFL
jgi:hypothetical protein